MDGFISGFFVDWKSRRSRHLGDSQVGVGKRPCGRKKSASKTTINIETNKTLNFRAPKNFSLPLVPLLAIASVSARAQLEVLPDKQPQQIFSGDGRKITVKFLNVGGKNFESGIVVRLSQTSSATTVLVSETPWKKLQVLAGQTVIETAALNFPAVKAETRFLVQWADSQRKVLGTTTALIYPPDLLKQLKPLAGDEPLGVFDPQNQLKPLLKSNAVEFADLEDSGVGTFSGKLAIIGPFESKSQMRDSLADYIKTVANKGAAIVWIQPPPTKRDKLEPSFYTVAEGKGAVVVVQPDLVSTLPESPQSQLNLIHFCNLALHPEPIHLPHSTPQP